MNDQVAAPRPIQYGSFTNRMMASIIDVCVIFFLTVPLVKYTMAHFFPPIDPSGFYKILRDPEYKANTVAAIFALMHEFQEQHLFFRLLVEYLLQGSFIALYVLPFWFRYSTTPGKMLFRMQIRDAVTGEPMSRVQAVLRFIGYIFSAVPLSLGFVWILVNRKRRGLHDYIARTVVVVKPKSAKATSLVPPSEGP